MISLIQLKENFTIYQLSGFVKVPDQIFKSSFYSITRTNEEVSVVTDCNIIFEDLKYDGGWRGFRTEGILELSLTGIINEITLPLKVNNIPVFIISTFNSDYIFVKKESFEKATGIFKTTENIKIIDQDQLSETN